MPLSTKATTSKQGKKLQCIVCIEQFNSCCSACVSKSVSVKKSGSAQSLDLTGWALKP